MSYSGLCFGEFADFNLVGSRVLPGAKCYDTNSTRECSLIGVGEGSEWLVVQIPRPGSFTMSDKVLGRNQAIGRIADLS